MTTPAERVEPFAALVYNPQRAGPLASLLAPPYDLIGPEQQDELYARSPYNVVRLELNRDADPYDSAARTLRRWRAEGIVERAARPAIYHYTQRFAVEGRVLRRRALVARVRLEEFQTGRILPHERTFPKAREDRLRLLAATRTNISPIFGLCGGKHPELERLIDEVGARAPILDATDDLGVSHELRPIDALEAIALIKEALEPPRILIADGHHRYETALEYRRCRRAEEGQPSTSRPYDYTMMALVGCADPGLVILATHRVVRGISSEALAAFAARVRELFDVEELEDPEALRARLKESGRGTIGVALAREPGFRLLKLRERRALAAAMPEVPAVVRELDVSVLHALVLDRLLGLDTAKVRAGGNVEYTIDAGAALEAARSAGADAAFLVNPATIGDIERAAEAGATMPEKSTYFHPKLVTGLVMNPLADA